ncbi:MAG TPA: helix-turn-helix domain-containing protein [Pseudonocardiaceae bacterium]|jgi:AcrR family transcriptional regulator|nr:helix-turn-helix domain-containing protein [Pseudonocardiaceae bacterium]
MDETPAQRRARHRALRHEVLAEPPAERRDMARRLLNEQREERRAARGRGRSGRAPAMSVEDRQAAIIAAALPLLIEHGSGVTTSQIATAAGIAEGTVFRAFRDKRELFVACLRAALRAEQQVAEINAIPADLPLAKRLIEAMEIVGGYQQRMWAVMQAVHSSGVELDHHSFESTKDNEDGSIAPNGAKHGFMQVADAITGLFEAETTQLRTSPELASRLLLGLMFTNQMQDERLGGVIARPAELVDLFLHGTLHTPTGGREN